MSTQSRKDRLNKLKSQIDTALRNNEHDVHAESTMIASHTGTRIRRGVIEVDGGCFVTDTRDFNENEGTLEEDTAELGKGSDFHKDGNQTIEHTPVAKTVSIESNTLLDDTLLAYLDTSLSKSDISNKKQKLNPKPKSELNNLSFDNYESDDNDDGETNKLVSLNATSTTIAPTSGFSQVINNKSAIYEITRDIQQKTEAAKLKTGVKHQIGQRYSGVSFQNESYNRQINRDYKEQLANIKNKMEHRK